MVQAETELDMRVYAPNGAGLPSPAAAAAAAEYDRTVAAQYEAACDQ